MRELNFRVEGLKIEAGLTTEVEGLSPRAPLTLTTVLRCCRERIIRIMMIAMMRIMTV